uniref:SFRICE_029523 n=1 Tax=Spodoptera frugiperda TaxID=7108 RepID=A0A2H1WZ99_SPOFR
MYLSRYAYRCCPCNNAGKGSAAVDRSGRSNLPLICLVPHTDNVTGSSARNPPRGPAPRATAAGQNDFQLLDEDYIKKHFKLPPRALYLDPFRRPLITFPLTQEGGSKNFNISRKQKINQQILDGFLDPSAAISAPSVFPYDTSQKSAKAKAEEEDEEIIYILQLPDFEYKCPIHNATVKTPRFIWHSCKKQKKSKSATDGGGAAGGGPLHKPKPWILSRITDFDLLSQW